MRRAALVRFCTAFGAAWLGLGTATAATTPSWPHWLQALAIDVDWSVAEVTWADTTIGGVHGHVRGRAGAYLLEARSARLAGGRAALVMHRDPVGSWTAKLHGSGIRLGDLGLFTDQVSDLPVRVAADLRGRGLTAAALATSLDGHVDLRSTGPGRIERSVERMGGSILASLFRAMVPWRNADETTAVECLHMHLPLRGGRVAAPLLVELWTQRTRVVGGGWIDLGTQRLALDFTPVARRGLQVRGLQAVRAFSMAGDLAAPQVILDSAGLLQRAAGLGVAVATGGGTTVLDTWRARRESRREPCTAVAAQLRREAPAGSRR